MVVALDGSIAGFELGGGLNTLHVFSLVRRSSGFRFLAVFLSVLPERRSRRVRDHACANTLPVASRRRARPCAPAVRPRRERDRSSWRPSISTSRSASMPAVDALHVASRTRAASALVDVDDLAAVRERVERGPQVGGSDRGPPGMTTSGAPSPIRRCASSVPDAGTVPVRSEAEHRWCGLLNSVAKRNARRPPPQFDVAAVTKSSTDNTIAGDHGRLPQSRERPSGRSDLLRSTLGRFEAGGSGRSARGDRSPAPASAHLYRDGPTQAPRLPMRLQVAMRTPHGGVGVSSALDSVDDIALSVEPLVNAQIQAVLSTGLRFTGPKSRFRTWPR